MLPLPKLRPIDIFPVKAEGEVRFAMRDPYEIQENTLVLSPVAYFISIHLDGGRTPQDIQTSFAQYFDKQILPGEVIEKVIKVLDENFFLDNERFAARAKEVNEAFRKSPNRPSSHAGLVYQDQAEPLRKQLAGHFNAPEGPGADAPRAQGELRGVVSPHIDFHRGGPWYAWAYREVLRREMADLYVILGVAHVSPPVPFVLTDKTYETPLGPAPTDRELTKALAKSLDWDPFEYEMVHRKEHSIEFQSVYLRYCAEKAGKSPKFLPILASGLAGTQDDSAGIQERTHEFLKKLAERLDKYPGKVCLVAGVDLAHIGRRFGDDFDITPEKLAWMEKGDRAGMEFVLSKDASGWYRSVVDDENNARKVCGLGALYAFTWLMRELYPKAEGAALGYSHAPDPAGGEVSFASMSFVE